MWGYCTNYSKTYDEGFSSKEDAIRHAENGGDGEGYVIFHYDDNEVIQEAFNETGGLKQLYVGKTLEACF